MADIFADADKNAKRGKPAILPFCCSVLCSGRRHRIEITSKGRLRFLDHPIADIRRELREAGPKVMGNLGMRYGCLRVFRGWPASFTHTWFWGDHWLPQDLWRVQSLLRNRNRDLGSHARLADKTDPLLASHYIERARLRVENAILKRVGMAKTSIITAHRYHKGISVEFGPPGIEELDDSFDRRAAIIIRVRPSWLRKIHARRLAFVDGCLVLDILSGDGRKPGSVLLVAKDEPVGGLAAGAYDNRKRVLTVGAMEILKRGSPEKYLYKDMKACNTENPQSKPSRSRRPVRVSTT